MDRNLHLKGAKNTRDFYGLPTEDGRTVATRKFIRTCTLDKLSRKDKDILFNQYGIKKIIDLRDVYETEEKPDIKYPGVEYINIPIFTETTVGISFEKKSLEMLDQIPPYEVIYTRMVTEEGCREHLRQVFDIIVNSEEPVVWHCSEGKDRCGIVSALFLAILGVPYKEIMDDYLLTNDVPSKNKDRYYKLVLLATKSKKKADAILPLFEAREEFLAASFEAIERDFGGIDKFIENELSISKEKREMLQNKYLK